MRATRAPRRQRVRRGVVLAITLVVRAGVVTTVVVVQAGRVSNAALAATVRRDVATTVAARSREFTAIERVTQGSSFTIASSGRCSTIVLACEVHAYVERGPAALLAYNPMAQRYVNGVDYVHLGPKEQPYLPTPWISVPVRSASATSGAEAPSQQLVFLARPGARVLDLGTTTLAGRSVHEYQVTVSDRRADRRVSSRFPRWVRQESLTTNQNHVVVRIDVDTHGRIVYDKIRAHVLDGADPVTVVVTETVTRFGVPVSVSAPPTRLVTPQSVLDQLATGHPSTS